MMRLREAKEGEPGTILRQRRQRGYGVFGGQLRRTRGGVASGNRARSQCTARNSRMRRSGHAAAIFSMSFAAIVNSSTLR